MLGQRLQRWPKLKPTVRQCPMLACNSQTDPGKHETRVLVRRWVTVCKASSALNQREIPYREHTRYIQ